MGNKERRSDPLGRSFCRGSREAAAYASTSTRAFDVKHTIRNSIMLIRFRDLQYPLINDPVFLSPLS